MSVARFIADQGTNYRVPHAVSCRLLGVSRSGFHAWERRAPCARELEDLPKNARDYVQFLEDVSGAPISAIGVGQDRDATIAVRDLIN